MRWTLARLDDDLAPYHDAIAARLLRVRIADLRTRVGAGDARRPTSELRAGSNEWVTDATQAMGWVADECGLGGARALDGMSWDLPIDEVWEAWADAFFAELAPRCGMTALRRGTTTRRLNWTTHMGSMRKLMPDSGVRGADQLVWVDAKCKAHLTLLAQRGWAGLEEATRDALARTCTRPGFDSWRSVSCPSSSISSVIPFRFPVRRSKIRSHKLQIAPLDEVA